MHRAAVQTTDDDFLRVSHVFVAREKKTEETFPGKKSDSKQTRLGARYDSFCARFLLFRARQTRVARLLSRRLISRTRARGFRKKERNGPTRRAEDAEARSTKASRAPSSRAAPKADTMRCISLGGTSRCDPSPPVKTTPPSLDSTHPLMPNFSPLSASLTAFRNASDAAIARIQPPLRRSKSVARASSLWLNYSRARAEEDPHALVEGHLRVEKRRPATAF